MGNSLAAKADDKKPKKAAARPAPKRSPRPDSAFGASNGVPLFLQRQPDSTAPATAPHREPPTIKQGPIGDVVVPVGDWQFLDAKVFSKDWGWTPEEVTFITVPVPELGVNVAVKGSAGAQAGFSAGLEGGTLRNIRVGLSYSEAAELALSSALGAGELALAEVLAFDDIRGLADLEIPIFFHADVKFSAEVNAAAKALGLFTVAKLGAGFEASAGAGVRLIYGGPIGLYYEGGHLRFNFHQSLETQLKLVFKLMAWIKATLLGFSWKRHWMLADKELNRSWKLGAPMALNFDNGAQVTLPLGEEAIDGMRTLQELFSMASSAQDELAPLALPAPQPDSQTAGPGGPGGGSGGSGGQAHAPRGRSPSDPIDMFWYKSPGLYPAAITLAGHQYFLTEPDWLDVPAAPAQGRDPWRDVRRDAHGGEQIQIGVSPESKFYPKLGKVWPRERAGVIRTGRKQQQFRRLLEAHGFDWRTPEREADHVRDLQWAGEDDYANLWPLNRERNNAANQILQQPVTYQDDAGNVVTVPLQQTPLGRYFRIIGYA